MKKPKLVLVIILVATSIIFAERKTDAWYSYGKPGDWPIHTALALLSSEKVKQSDEFKGINRIQIFDVLADGANAPDRHKKWLDHEATFRIENTLCASVNERRNLDALKRLAIGFHYLGDNGDATEGSYKKELAEIAYKMLFEEDDTNKDPKYEIRWGFRKSSRWRELKFNYDQKISQIDNVDSLVKALRDMAEYQGRRLRNAYRQENFITVREEFMHTFAFIRACQNRLIDFYNEELINGETGQCCHGTDGRFQYCKGKAGKERRDECTKKKQVIEWKSAAMTFQGRPKDGKPWACADKICWSCPPGYSWGIGNPHADIAAGRSVQCGKHIWVPDCPQ